MWSIKSNRVCVSFVSIVHHLKEFGLNTSITKSSYKLSPLGMSRILSCGADKSMCVRMYQNISKLRITSAPARTDYQFQENYHTQWDMRCIRSSSTKSPKSHITTYISRDSRNIWCVKSTQALLKIAQTHKTFANFGSQFGKIIKSNHSKNCQIL